MQKGDRIDGEYRQFRDERTGALIHQLTRGGAMSHSLFFLSPSFRPGTAGEGQQVAFVTYRGGVSRLCLFDFATHTARVLTDGDGLQPFSPGFSPDGMYLYYTTAAGDIRRLDPDSLDDQTIYTEPGGNLGEASLSRDGRYTVSSCKRDATFALIVVDVEKRTGGVILETGFQMIHPQFHPRDPNVIIYAGHPIPRLWTIGRDGSNNRCLYQNAWNEFIVHESFLGDSDDLIFAVWPNRLGRLNFHEPRMQTICDLNAWHMASNRAGTLIVTDTNHPDRGLLLVDPKTGDHRPLCYPGASCHGSQWKQDYPATPQTWQRQPDADADQRVLSWMEMKVDTVYGPQWTHPHPAFDDSAKRVVYTSDADGEAQVYVVEVDE